MTALNFWIDDPDFMTTGDTQTALVVPRSRVNEVSTLLKDNALYDSKRKIQPVSSNGLESAAFAIPLSLSACEQNSLPETVTLALADMKVSVELIKQTPNKKLSTSNPTLHSATEDFLR